MPSFPLLSQRVLHHRLGAVGRGCDARVEGGSFGADIMPPATDLKGSPHEGVTRDGGRELPELTRSWSWPSTWTRSAATALPGITDSLIEGLALTAAAEHSEPLLPPRQCCRTGSDKCAASNARQVRLRMTSPIASVVRNGFIPSAARSSRHSHGSGE